MNCEYVFLKTDIPFYPKFSRDLLVPRWHRTSLYQKSHLYLRSKLFNKLNKEFKSAPNLYN